MPEKLVVSNGKYYLSLLKKLYTITFQGEVLNIYDNKYVINDFNIIKDKIILTSRNSINVINNVNKIISTQPFEVFDAQNIPSSIGLCYSPSVDDKITEFYLDKNFSIVTKNYAPVSRMKELKDLHLSYSKGGFMFAFSIHDRKVIYVLNKDLNKNTLFKKVVLDDPDCTPNNSTILNDEGDPNFKISSSGGIYYIVVLIKGKLKIFSFVL